jgi:HAE1 family hydrophobic/amphiphilic exporter-1
MNALTIFIRRAVLATMVTVLLLVFGLFSYRTLGVDLMPKIEVPYVTITTTLRGASPEEVESEVTKTLEEAVNTISGIDTLMSYSLEGMSMIGVQFVLERPMAEAVQDVRDKVATVARLLPVGTDPPVITKIDFDAFAVLALTVSGPSDLKEVSEVARLRVKQALETVDGVGQINLLGGRKRAINVVLDVDRLQAYGIPIAAVKGALATQNVEIPSGRIDRGESEQVLRTLARIEEVEDFQKIVVASRGGRQITVGEIARVEDSVEEPRTSARVWRAGDAGRGTPSVTLNIVKQSGTNTVETIRRIKQRIAEIEPTLPPGYRIGIVSDQSIFIERSISELSFHLVLGGLLSAVAVLLFMRNLRSTIIAAVAIPTSLIATFTLMRALHFTLNNMSMLGLTLAVGVVIDDAIVVLENIFRHMEQYGKTPFQAAIDGLKEIGMAVMATTTSLIVIFLPIAFMSGMIGRFFYEFGLTVAFALVISLIVSFTLTPMLSSRFLKQTKGAHAEEDHGLLARGYGGIIRWALRRRWVTAVTCIGVLAATVPIAKRLGTDFLPADDRGEFQVTVIAPSGSSLKAVEEQFGKVEDEIHKLRGVQLTLTQIGSATGAEDVTRGTIYVAIEDLSKRKYSQFDTMRAVRKILGGFPEVRSAVNPVGGMMSSGARASQLTFNLVGPDLDELTRISNEVARQARQMPGIVDVDTSLAARQPEIRVRLDRQKAADLGISPSDVASTLRTMVGGEIATKYREGTEQYDVWLRLDRRDRNDAALIEQLPLVSQRAGLVPLSQVSTLGEGKGPSEIDRLNRQRLVSIYSNLDGTDLGSAMAKLQKVVDGLELPPGYRSVSTGQSKMMGEMITQMGTAFLLAFVFMYIVLAAQFESFLHPVTILLSLPLTVPFALLSLLLLRETINIYSILGVFMLFGIVKKNGILQIDYTNTLRARGRPLVEAIVEANRARLRPILMTTLTLIAGMTPIALGTGPGAASRASLAKVIIGGQALSLFITLLIVPVAYSLFEGIKRRLGIGQPSPTQAPEPPAGGGGPAADGTLGPAAVGATALAATGAPLTGR